MNGDPISFIGRSAANFSKELAVKYARVPGVHILVRGDRCTGCGSCVRKGFCRVQAISVVDRKASVDERRCRGCGRCTHLCPRNALALELRPPAMVRSTLMRVDQEISRVLGPNGKR
jgi:heterodisulfide reductase subunit A-like polyferredoxin